MTREDERLLITEAIGSNHPILKVQEACAKILVERIEDSTVYDLEMQRILIKIASKFKYGIDMEIVKKSITHRTIPSRSKIISCGIAGVIGLSMTLAENSFIKLFGGAISLIAGIGLGYELNNSTESIETKVETKLSKTANDILLDLDEIYQEFQSFFAFNQLEKKYSALLKWIQDQWHSDTDDDFQRDLRKLLNRINYEFVEFGPGLASAFEQTQVPDIDKPQTTLPAIRNLESGDIVIRGHAIFPMP